MKIDTQIPIDFSGAHLRDIGIQIAVDHAQSEISNWKEITWNLFREFLREQREPFLIEDFRSYLAMKPDYEFPDNLRAFGFLPAKAARQGLIKQIGTMKVKNPKAHVANAALWQKIS